MPPFGPYEGIRESTELEVVPFFATAALAHCKCAFDSSSSISRFNGAHVVNKIRTIVRHRVHCGSEIIIGMLTKSVSAGTIRLAYVSISKTVHVP
jgi:hypothetical protein